MAIDLKRAKPVAGRRLGWSDDDLATYQYAHHWNPQMGPVGHHVVHALANGPVAEPLLPPLERAIGELREVPVATGYTVTEQGAMHVNVVTELPGVTPAMVDWWFGWHGDSPERYKLWHPHAHVHTQWSQAPAEGTVGRARYLGNTSEVDEYVGDKLSRLAISFRPPEQLGLDDEAVATGRSTAICARVGLVDVPVDAGWLVHLVDPVPGGSVMRSFFWVGASYAAPRKAIVRGAMPVVRRIARPTEVEARNLLAHCAQEMTHLSTFLPALFEEEADT